MSCSEQSFVIIHRLVQCKEGSVRSIREVYIHDELVIFRKAAYSMTE